LPPGALDDSREVLRSYGNMSSATVMFVLQRMLRSATAGQKGCAMSFGPGLVAETMTFHIAG
jgi:predicted naringenin-chalcone synthase